MIQVYRPAREIEEIISSGVTDVRLDDGKVQTYIEYGARPMMFSEEPWQVFQALRVTGAALTGVEFRDDTVYYTLSSLEQAYIPTGLLEHDWWSRDGRLRRLTGVRLAGDGVDYEVLDGGRPDVRHETEESVLATLRVRGVRLAGADLKEGNVYFTFAESNFTTRAG